MISRPSLPAKARPFRLRGNSRLGLRIVACGITLLFIATALMQYRWNLQIRRAAETGLGASLESVMVKWHLNLYRELSTICIALQVGPDSGAHNHWNDYLQRFEAWRRAAGGKGVAENIYSNPDVVSDVYLYETSGSSARTFRLDPDANRIEALATPMKLWPFLDYLRKKSGTLRLALRAWDPNSSAQASTSESDLSELETKTITGWQFEADIPAVVHPLVHHFSKGQNRKPSVDWLIVVLNRDAIIRRVLPALATRYFDGKHGLEYKLAVAAVGNTSRLLYSSDQGFGLRDLGDSDSSMTIFGPPPESTEGSFWQVSKSRDSLHGDEWRNFPGPVWFPVFQQTGDTHQWVLFLKRRAGPLEGAVTKVWLVNFFIGSIMLLLLAASFVLVFIAAHRVRTLATMRMDFVTSISHELRTPLAAILASGQNLCDGFASDQSYYGAQITTQARRLIDLVDQVLLFASMRDGKKKHPLSPVAIYDVFESLRKTFLAILGNAGFHVDWRLDDNLPPVLADPQALARCLQSLIENAAKYSGDSKWIGVSAERDDFGRKDAGIKIMVADHGVGIDPSDLPNIFEPFYRSPAVIAAQIHGNGLGLSVARDIVKEMGGRLSVTSEVGKGSVFTLHLRVA
jgi:signal transduction histidine kinase